MEVLQARGFGSKWRGWMLECPKSATSSVIVNGEPGSQFQCRRGLRLCDPLCPYLFILVIDVFTKILGRAGNQGIMRRVESIPWSHDLFSLHYADDTLIMCNGDQQSIINLKVILLCFEGASGLRVNFHKSSIYNLGPNQSIAARASSILGCRVDSLPFTYLGLPIKSTTLTRTDWQPLVDRFARRLSPWKDRRSREVVALSSSTQSSLLSPSTSCPSTISHNGL